MIQQECKNDDEQGVSKKLALPFAATYIERLRRRDSKLKCAFHIHVKRLENFEDSWWTASLAKDFAHVVSTDLVKSFCEVNKNHKNWLSSLSGFLRTVEMDHADG